MSRFKIDKIKTRYIIYIALLLSFIVQLIIISQGPVKLLEQYTGDDFYYYLKISQNMVLGKGMTFDGTTQTTGFHPLMVFTLLPVYSLFSSNLILPVYYILVIMAALTAFSSLFIYKIGKLLNNEYVGVIAALLWLFNPYIALMSVSGFETPFVVFFLFASLYTYLKIKISKNYYWKNILLLGVLLGLLFLSRTDTIIFIILLLLDFAISQYKTRNKNTKFINMPHFKNIFLLGITIFLISLPWFILSYVNVGTVFPGSANAVRYMDIKQIFPEYSINNPVQTVPYLKQGAYNSLAAVAQVMAYAGGGNIYPTQETMLNKIHVLSVVFASGAFFILILLKLKKFKEFNSKLINAKFLIFYFIFHILFYSFYMFAKDSMRYHIPLMSVVLIVIPSCIYFVYKEYFNNAICKRIFKIFSILLILFFFISTFIYIQIHFVPNNFDYRRYYDAAIWLKENTSNDIIVGCPNSGILGYYSDRKVVNLDGVVNPDAFNARFNNNLTAYMIANNITYVLDRADYLESYNSNDNNQLFKYYFKWKIIDNAYGSYGVTIYILNESIRSG